VKRLSAPIILSSAALFFSLTGAGLAASRYVITSTNQIKPSVVKALRGKHGATGLTGLIGATGATGAAGAFSASDITIANGPQVTLGGFGSGNNSGSSTANCPAGATAISGGYVGTGSIEAVTSQPTGSSWFVAALGPGTVYAVAVCAS
jgi:hypothetical protein